MIAQNLRIHEWYTINLKNYLQDVLYNKQRIKIMKKKEYF